MNITVRAAGQVVNVSVEPTTTVARLRSLVAERLKGIGITLKPEQIRLKSKSGAYLGDGAADSSTLASLGVTSDTTLDLGRPGPPAASTTSPSSSPPTTTSATAPPATTAVPSTASSTTPSSLPTTTTSTTASSTTTSTTTSTTATPSSFRSDVVAVMAKDLASLAEYKDPVGVFIGIGSYVAHQTADKVYKQQCPPKLLEVCYEAKLPLRVLLVDPGFGLTSLSQQVYDLDPRWQSMPLPSSEAGKVARYRSTSGDMQIWVYPTAILSDEYAKTQLTPSQAKQDASKRTLGGIDLQPICDQVAKTGVFVAGNFYEDAAPYLVDGDPSVLEALGKPYYLGT